MNSGAQERTSLSAEALHQEDTTTRLNAEVLSLLERSRRGVDRVGLGAVLYPMLAGAALVCVTVAAVQLLA